MPHDNAVNAKLRLRMEHEKLTKSQYAERILNEIAKPFNENFARLKCMLQGFRICFV